MAAVDREPVIVTRTSGLLPAVETAVNGETRFRITADGTLYRAAAGGALLPYVGTSDPLKADKASLAFNVNDYLLSADPIQAALNACSAAGGGLVEIPAGVWTRTAAASIPNFVNVRGHGQSTVVRCASNHYAFTFNPGHRSSISDMTIEATGTQTSGGGFDFTNAGSNIWLDGIYFGSGLFTSLNIAPTGPAGIYVFRRLRWNGVANCDTAIKIGGGGGLVTDMNFSDCIGTASTRPDVARWLWVLQQADTIKLDNCTFYRGTLGAIIGSAQEITNTTFSAVTIDDMAGRALDVQRAREFKCDAVEISSSGAADIPGLEVGVGSKGFRFNNGVIQNCAGYGAIIRNGAVHTHIQNSIVTDNNTTNTAFNDGIAVATDTVHFTITGNTSGNGVLLASGHQKYGISVSPGTSDHYIIANNRLTGNETANTVLDLGTGVAKSLTGNVA